MVIDNQGQLEEFLLKESSVADSIPAPSKKSEEKVSPPIVKIKKPKNIPPTESLIPMPPPPEWAPLEESQPPLPSPPPAGLPAVPP